MARVFLLALLGFGALGCGFRADQGRRERAASGAGAPAASVNGEPITSDEVAALCRATGMPAKQALERLVAARLLTQHARRLGYEHDALVARGVTQARVQQLLAVAVEQGSAPTEIEARRRKLDALLAELARRTRVQYDEDAIAKLFAGAPP